MADIADHQVKEPGKFRRALAVVLAWIEGLDRTPFDYALDRIELLEREVKQIKEELRQRRETDRVAPPL